VGALSRLRRVEPFGARARIHTVMHERWIDATALPQARSYPLQLLTALFWTTAAIHVVASTGHFSEWWLYGAFFACLAAWQAVWGVLIYRQPSENAILTGAGVNVGVALLWLVTRTTGLPFGPDRWSPENVGVLDVAATLDELLIAGLGLALLSATWRRRLGTRPFEWLLLVLLIASGVALMAGGHHH
jgi:hypothetical protein